MTDVGTARVRVTGDTKRLEQDIERGTTRAAKDAGKKSGKTLGQELAKNALTVGAGVLIATEIAKQINAASDLGETISKTGKVFGDASAEVEAWSDTTADGIGQSKRAALDAASTFGIFGKSAGLAGSDLVGFSTKLTTLASDLASLNNTTPEEAVQALGAALRGEAEPIRRYGVLLDDATLRQEALAQGLISTTKDALTPQQRVLAAQAAIFKQTTVAQGDFADTSDGLANSQRILAANLEDARAELGQQWLPVALEATETATDLLKKFSGLPDPLQKASIALGLIGGATFLLAPRVMATVEALSALRGSLVATRIASSAVLGPIGLIVAAIGGIALAWKDVKGDLTTGAFDPKNLEGFGAEVESTRAKIELFESGAANLPDKLGLVAEGIRSWENPLIAADKAMREQIMTQQGYGTAINDIADKTGKTRESVEELAVSVWDTNDSYLNNKDALLKAATAADRTTASQEALDGAISSAGDASATAKDQADAYRQALDALSAPALDVRAAQRAYKDALDAAGEAQKENGATLDINTEKGRANATALDAIATAALDSAAAIRTRDGDEKRANETLEVARKKLQKQAEAFGLSTEEAKKYVGQVLGIPEVAKTDVDLNTKAARVEVAEFKKWLADQNAVIPASLKLSKADQLLLAGATAGSPAAARIGARAQGGPVRPYEPYWVGEYGPELMVPNHTGVIKPTYDLGDLGSTATNVGVRVFIGDRELTDIVRTEVTHSEDDLALALSGGSL